MDNNNNASLSFLDTSLWLGSVTTDSAAIFPSYNRSVPVDSVKSTRIKQLKRRLHARSPLSSIENLPRVTGARVGPMKDDNVLVMDAVTVAGFSRVSQFAQGIEEFYGSNISRPIKPITEMEKPPNGKATPGIKSHQTVPAQQKKVTQVEKDYYSGISKEEEEIILKTLYGPSDKKRLPVFIEICPE